MILSFSPPHTKKKKDKDFGPFATVKIYSILVLGDDMFEELWWWELSIAETSPCHNVFLKWRRSNAHVHGSLLGVSLQKNSLQIKWKGLASYFHLLTMQFDCFKSWINSSPGYDKSLRFVFTQETPEGLQLLVFGVPHIYWRRIQIQMEVFTTFTNQARILWCSQLGPAIENWVLRLCYSSRLGFGYSRLILDISRLVICASRLVSGSDSFLIQFYFLFWIGFEFSLSLRRCWSGGWSLYWTRIILDAYINPLGWPFERVSRIQEKFRFPLLRVMRQREIFL